MTSPQPGFAMRAPLQTPRRFSPAAPERSGFALPAALAVLLVLSVLVVAVYANAMAAFRSGTTDLGKTRSYYAAEAGAESALAQLSDALDDAVLQDQELAMITAPTMTDFAFDSFSVAKVGGVVPERITDGPFTGLYSLTQMVDVYSEASDPARNSSAVMVSAKTRAIPIFQLGVFYE
jgi:type II secretory pathway component PulK